MKKVIAVLLALAMILSLVACGSSSSSSSSDPSGASENTTDASAQTDKEGSDTEEAATGTVNTNDTINVGFVQLVDMADGAIMYEAFVQRLEDEGYGDKINIDFESASGDTGTMSTIIQGFVDNNYDIVIPMLTPPTQAAVTICGGEIPILYMSVVDPVYSGVNPDWDTVDPGILATGTSNTIPANLMVETAQSITPLEGDDYILIIYNTSQTNSECTMEDAVAYCEENNLAYDVIGYADVTDALTQLQAVDYSSVGYVYVTLDSIIAASFNQVGELLVEEGVPCYAVADAMVTGGAFLSYGVDYAIVGEMTADMLIEWYNGTALEDMVPERYSDFELVVNEGVMEALGIELPEEYASIATYVETQ